SSSWTGILASTWTVARSPAPTRRRHAAGRSPYEVPRNEVSRNEVSVTRCLAPHLGNGSVPFRRARRLRGPSHRLRDRPDERFDRRLGERSRGIARPPSNRCLPERFDEGSISLSEGLEHLWNRGVTGRPGLTLGPPRHFVWPLSQHAESSENPAVLTETLLLDGLDGSLEEPAHRLAALESDVGEGSQSELFWLCPPVVEQRPSDPTRVTTRPSRQVEPPEAPRPTILHEGQTAETRPVPTAPNEPLLHPVREDVPHPFE